MNKTDKRKELLKRALQFQTLPTRNYEVMSDEQLERFVTMLECAFEEAYREE